MNFTFDWRLAILGKCFELGLDEFAERTIFKTLDDRTCAQDRHEKHAAARYNAAGFVHFAEKSSLFDGWETQ